MTDETRLLRLEDSVKEIKDHEDDMKEQQTQMEARLAAMENSMKHMEEMMNKWMTRTAAKKSKDSKGSKTCGSVPKTKHRKLEIPSDHEEDDGADSTAVVDWVLWPARVIGCCD
ncbi:myosin-2 [Sesbania bispinosa]|nr:myosin-2 [Sesbania bispinosa]